MKARQYFPLGKAYGEAFCNRVNETMMLAGNVQNGKHSFIVAPRRYGKSSLCENAIEKLELASARIDLHIATSQKAIERIILKAVVDLIGKTIGSIEKVIQSLKYQLKHLKPKFSMDASKFHLEFEVSQNSSPPEIIREALLLLDELLRAKKKQAVMLLDEFQRVVEIAPDMGIEGAIRSAAQEMQNLALIFSGSGRHLIESIFQDEGRPLYKLCKKIKLERISQEHYKIHLNKAAQLMWKKELEMEVFLQIMKLTQRHPYYVNYACDALWSNSESFPKIDDVNEVWNLVVEEERSDLLREYFSMTENQKKLLIYLASNLGTNLYSTETSKKTDIPPTSISKTLRGLMEKDIIEEYKKGCYGIINPIYKSILAE
jgi:AAA+ ATPase superfamily predicted ATPase